MKHLKFLLALLVLIPTSTAFAASDYYLKIDGVEGEAKSDTARVTEVEPVKTEPIDDWTMPPNAAVKTIDVERDSEVDVVTTQVDRVVKPPTQPQEGKTDALLELGGVDGESTKSGARMEDDTAPVTVPLRDVMTNPEPITPDFGILLGGGAETEALLLQSAKEEGLAAEQISLNYEKIKTTVRSSGKLFGLFTVSLPATVEIDGEARVKVRFPWWGFLVSGKDGDALGEKVFTTISNVLKTKHDTVKNSIGNVR